MIEDGEIVSHAVYGQCTVLVVHYRYGAFQGAYLSPATAQGIENLVKASLNFSNRFLETEKHLIKGA